MFLNQEKRIHEQLRQTVLRLIKEDFNIGISQTELATKLNINRTALSNILNDSEKVSITYLIKILTVYGYSISVKLEPNETFIKDRALRKLNKSEKQSLNIKE
jgi:transcriptional regulator with XRE-family HTH domain